MLVISLLQVLLSWVWSSLKVVDRVHTFYPPWEMALVVSFHWLYLFILLKLKFCKKMDLHFCTPQTLWRMRVSMQFSVFLFIYNWCCIHEVNIRMEDFGTFCVCLRLNMYTTKPRIEQETLYHLTLSSLLHQHRTVTPTSSFFVHHWWILNTFAQIFAE